MQGVVISVSLSSVRREGGCEQKEKEAKNSLEHFYFYGDLVAEFHTFGE